MGILDRVRMAKEQFRVNSQRRATTSALQNKLDLEDAKAQRTTLEARRDVSNALAQERSAIRDLRNPFIKNVKEKLVNASQRGTSATKNYLQSRQRANKGKSLESQSSSPFAPQNFKQLGNNSSLGNSPFSMRQEPSRLKKKTKGKTIVIKL